MVSLVRPIPRLEGVEHRFIELPGLRMHVAMAGQGEPVLLLHGVPQHWWMWHKLMPGLAQHYRVICPDLRGAGWTEAPPNGYYRAQLTRDLVALMDALDLKQVRVVAHDWAALIAFALCMESPERVSRFVALGVPDPFIKLDAKVLGLFGKVWFNLVLPLPGLGPALLGRGRQALPRYMFTHFTSLHEVWTEENLADYLIPLREPARARAVAALYRRLILPGMIRLARGAYKTERLSTPTLVVLGADDPAASMMGRGRHEGRTDHLELEIVEGASHFIVDEQPGLILELTLEFFSKPTEVGEPPRRFGS